MTEGNPTKKLRKRCVNFKRLEQVCERYNEKLNNKENDSQNSSQKPNTHFSKQVGNHNNKNTYIKVNKIVADKAKTSLMNFKQSIAELSNVISEARESVLYIQQALLKLNFPLSRNNYNDYE